jgi:hypothetical protein
MVEKIVGKIQKEIGEVENAIEKPWLALHCTSEPVVGFEFSNRLKIGDGL